MRSSIRSAVRPAVRWGTYISWFFNRLEVARRSAWTDAVSSYIDINQLGNSDNTDTCIKHNAEIVFHIEPSADLDRPPTRTVRTDPNGETKSGSNN